MTELKPVIYTLVFRPEGVTPERGDFRTVRVPGSPPKEGVDFESMTQVGEYLAKANWPEGQHPWVSDGINIIGPEEVALSIPAT